MTRKATLLAAALIAAAPAAAPPAQGGGGPPLLRMRDGVGSDLIFNLHPVPPEPLRRPIRTFQGGYDLAFSPDGRFFASSHGWSSRSRGVVRLRPRGPLNVGWAGPRRLVAITNPSRGPQRILWIDPFRMRVLERRAFRGNMLEGVPLRGGYALALAPRTGTGPMRLLIARADGGPQAIELDGIVGGAPDGEGSSRFLKPALAVDEEGGRLYAIAARGELAAEVDLATGAVEHDARANSAQVVGDVVPAHGHDTA